MITNLTPMIYNIIRIADEPYAVFEKNKLKNLNYKPYPTFTRLWIFFFWPELSTIGESNFLFFTEHVLLFLQLLTCHVPLSTYVQQENNPLFFEDDHLVSLRNLSM